MGPLEFGLLAFSSLFAMVNPVSAAPIFVDLTRKHHNKRRQTAMKASLTALIALALFATAGSAIFSFFGITVPAFQIAGGLLFTLSSIRTLQGLPEHETTSEEGNDPSVVPLGIPLVAGAGAMSTVMVLAGQAQGSLHQLALWSAIILNIALTFVIFVTAPKLVSKIGTSGQEVMSKIMALLTAVIGIQFIIDGLNKVVGEWVSKAG